jgi:ADP-ribose pyrophosphatase YjhB (NUDIX family)
MSISKKWLHGSQIDDMSPLSLHTISAIVAVSDGRVLLQKGAYRGLEKWWSVPEDNLKFGEDPEECARRVLREQANVKVNSIELLYVQSSVYKEIHWDLWFIYKATVEGDPSPGKGNWEVKYFLIDKLPEDVHPQDKPDIEKYAR